MEINIRESIKNNFKGAKTEDIKASIVEAINEKDEVTLPGLGVFFEILWNHSEKNQQELILNTIQKNI